MIVLKTTKAKTKCQKESTYFWKFREFKYDILARFARFKRFSPLPPDSQVHQIHQICPFQQNHQKLQVNQSRQIHRPNEITLSLQAFKGSVTLLVICPTKCSTKIFKPVYTDGGRPPEAFKPARTRQNIIRIPHICHFFSTYPNFGLIFLHSKARKSDFAKTA